MAIKTLEDLFHDTLKDIYFAERQILKALPKMAKAAASDDLKEAFLHHREETEGQVERLQQVFEIISKRAQGKTCESIKGILEEGEEIIDEFEGSPALDSGLIGAAQAVEHYEICRYNGLILWAGALDISNAGSLLSANLAEEVKADALLTKLGQQKVRTAKAAA